MLSVFPTLQRDLQRSKIPARYFLMETRLENDIDINMFNSSEWVNKGRARSQLSLNAICCSCAHLLPGNSRFVSFWRFYSYMQTVNLIFGFDFVLSASKASFQGKLMIFVFTEILYFYKNHLPETQYIFDLVQFLVLYKYFSIIKSNGKNWGSTIHPLLKSVMPKSDIDNGI